MSPRPLPPQLAALVKGTTDERAALLATFKQLGPRLAQSLKDIVISVIEDRGDVQMAWPRGKEDRDALRGWFLGALAFLSGGQGPDAEFVLTRHLDARAEPLEWVRYWTLANIYRASPPPQRSKLASVALDDPSDLVRALAAAIHNGRPDLKSLEGSDLRAIWTCLRAVQVVGPPEAAERIVTLLAREMPGYIIYEALLALTASLEMQKHAHIAWAGIPIGKRAQIIVEGAIGTTPERLRRLALLLPGDEPALAALRSLAGSEHSEMAYAAKQLLEVLAGAQDQPRPLASGGWRMELAYRLVLARPVQFDILESLGSAQLASLADAVMPESRSLDPNVALVRLRDRFPGKPPNALWTAWIKTVHAAKLTQS